MLQAQDGPLCRAGTLLGCAGVVHRFYYSRDARSLLLGTLQNLLGQLSRLFRDGPLLLCIDVVGSDVT